MLEIDSNVYSKISQKSGAFETSCQNDFETLQRSKLLVRVRRFVRRKLVYIILGTDHAL